LQSGLPWHSVLYIVADGKTAWWNDDWKVGWAWGDVAALQKAQSGGQWRHETWEFPHVE
jgi:hypothetical protein